MKIKFNQILVLTFMLFACPIFSQSGLTFTEFRNKLLSYFNEEMVSDVEKNMPQRMNFSIWGWDIGDFSGDSNLDLAFSIKISQEKRKIVYVYLFVDIDGFLELVLNRPYEYFELPLEIGVSIRNNSCTITQKKKDNHWNMETYRFDSGIVYLIGTYSSERNLSHLIETQIDYTNCRKKISLVPLKSESSEKFVSDFIFIPSYPRSKKIYKGYPSNSNVNNIDYVVKGSYYWHGESDASYSILSSFDENYLYFSFNITDDIYVPKICPTCIADELHLWFDFKPVTSSIERIFKKGKNKFVPRDKPDENIYQIQLSLGNFVDIQPEIFAINSSITLDETQKQALNKVKIFSNPTDSGLVLKIRFPYELFGYEIPPIDESQAVCIGFTAIYIDVDNEYRPEETSWIATSIIEDNRPSTFGELFLITDIKKFSFAHNIYLESILKSIEDFGF